MNKPVRITLDIDLQVKPDNALYDLFQNDSKFRESVLGELRWKAITSICHHSGCGRDRITVKAGVSNETSNN